MKFGIALQWADVRHMGLSPTLIEVAERAQALGYHSLWTTDQLTARSNPAFSTEPLITITSLMHVVPEMQLGVAVLVLPLRSAPVVAKQAATLSLLSGGRFILGVGAGWNDREFKLTGADYGSRGRHMDESLEVMQRLWGEQGAGFQGEFYNFQGVSMLPRPEGGRVPLWIGGNSPAAVRRVAQVGDAWLPAVVRPQELKEGVKLLKGGSAGRQTPTVAAMLIVNVQNSGEEKDASAQVAGSVEEMIATLQAYNQAGLEHLIATFKAQEMADLSRQMRVFAEEVMPTFVG
jgi:probable F420-dependent oxidoreductase